MTLSPSVVASPKVVLRVVSRLCAAALGRLPRKRSYLRAPYLLLPTVMVVILLVRKCWCVLLIVLRCLDCVVIVVVGTLGSASYLVSLVLATVLGRLISRRLCRRPRNAVALMSLKVRLLN